MMTRGKDAESMEIILDYLEGDEEMLTDDQQEAELLESGPVVPRYRDADPGAGVGRRVHPSSISREVKEEIDGTEEMIV